jgi:hypothetical protein
VLPTIAATPTGTAGIEADELLLDDEVDELLDTEVEELLDTEAEELLDTEVDVLLLDTEADELLDAAVVLSPPAHPARSDRQIVATKPRRAIRWGRCSSMSLTPEHGPSLSFPRAHIIGRDHWSAGASRNAYSQGRSGSR